MYSISAQKFFNVQLLTLKWNEIYPYMEIHIC